MRRKRIWLLLIAVVVSALLLACGPSSDLGEARPIPPGLFDRQVPKDEQLSGYEPELAPGLIAHVPVPPHPFMASGAGNNMHNDAYMTDAYEAPGPVGITPRVFSRTQGFGGYGTVAFDRIGRLVAVYSNGGAFQLELLDPRTLEELANYDLPPRSLSWLLTGVMPWEYLGAGMYFYLDHEDRAVVPTTENKLLVVQVPNLIESRDFELVRQYDLTDHVVSLDWPATDSVAWVLPDWNGSHYWYATTAGLVGAVQAESGEVQTHKLAGEIVENAFAVGPDGVYLLSDQALYRFQLDGGGRIAVDWRVEYDRGPAKKPGHITRGSGTTVTLMGDRQDGLVAITDNAEPQIHLLFVRRADGSVVCQAPLFAPGRSGTDVSTAGFEHADTESTGTGRFSVLVENNWGHHRFPRSRPEPGLVRVDAERLSDGSFSCQQVWASEERSIGVFKLSWGSGLAYMYWRDEGGFPAAWYFTGVDFRTGATVFKQLTGTGVRYNNWAGALFLHPDGGLAYSTTIFGLVALEDAER